MPDSANRPTDLIIGRGLLAAESISQSLRNRLVRELGKLGTDNMARALELARAILLDFENLHVDNFMATDLAAWMTGAQGVVTKIPPMLLGYVASKGGMPPAGPPPKIGRLFGWDGEPTVRFPLIEEAAKSLLERRIVSPEEFARLSASERAKAFTMAGEWSTDALAHVRDALSETVAEGASIPVFKAKLRDRFNASEIGPGHLETVYRTNIQAAYSDGRETLAANPIVAELFPYARYVCIHDGRVRHQHLELEELGLDHTDIYRADDPMWDYFTPPWDFNCRCGKIMLTIEDAARAGVKEAQRWLKTGRAPLVPEYRISHIDFRPPPGFGGRRKLVAA